ncbi:hypothetical protein [Yersinia enterocolitica]
MVAQISSIGFPVPRVVSTVITGAKQSQATFQPSTRVTLSDASDEINAIYNIGAQKLRTSATSSNSQLAYLMSANLHQPVSVSFQGLGKALLLQLKDDPKDFSSAVAPSVDVQVSGDNDKAAAVALGIVTQSGVKVSVSLSRQQDGIVAQVQTSHGDLDENEVLAISGLADAFQAALDGLSAQPPVVSIDGLTQFDNTILKSVDLNTDVRQGNDSLQSLNYQSDNVSRGLSYKDSSVSFQLNTDLSHPEVLGTYGQQVRALSAYEQQLDSASFRGRGDKAQMDMFKTTFRAMNSHYGSNEIDSSQKTIFMSESDKARTYQSGLADFSASFQQAETSSNPLKKDEKDTFAYNFSQTTEESSNSRGELSQRVQNTKSHLQASYHEALDPTVPLSLGMLELSQSYTYHQINDESSSQTVLDFRKGFLATVASSKTTHNMELVKKYVSGRLVDENRTPYDNEKTHQLQLKQFSF